MVLMLSLVLYLIMILMVSLIVLNKFRKFQRIQMFIFQLITILFCPAVKIPQNPYCSVLDLLM
ncbi:unnamed protein product [Staurois parvus]|uniref:NADH dehydrogenase subunit 1 n=1 Tax=Staurois parvus TaxID=386267 RepID=A0ABN9GV94_9NEOB|nr:unnamed protein product [Staurois parvus]